MAALTFFVPSLFGNLGSDLPELPGLQTLLAKGDAESGGRSEFPQALFDLFAYEKTPATDYPVAAFTQLIDFDSDEARFMMRADPVYLRPDLGTLVLFDSCSLEFNEGEAATLVAELNLALAPASLEIRYGSNYRRWYIELQDAPRIRTTPLAAVVGRSIDPSLPAGEDAGHWQRIVNEAQMVLHSSAVNQARQARGELPVNSIWLWGAGYLPVAPSVNWTKVWSDDVLAGGLARRAGIDWSGLPRNALEWRNSQKQSGNLLIIPDPAGEGAELPDGHSHTLEKLEKDWFSPLLAMLKSGQLQKLVIDTGSMRVSVTRSSLLRFWRRRRPMHCYVDESSVEPAK